jgi:hypothetical protein
MRSPALAIGWEFRQRHRWGLIAVAGYLLVVAIIKLVVLEPGQIVELSDAHSFAAVVVVPLSAMFTYFLAVFSFGLSGDIAARQSIYPARLFTLPVTTSALAGWPMFYGAVAVAILWLATRLLAVWPTWMEVPVIWPGVLAVSLLAWTQALTWMPYGLPGLRVIAATLWLATFDAIVMVAIYFKISEPLMVAFVAPQIPLAYLVARYAVGRARRGDVPDWRGTFTRLGQIADVLPRRRGNFHSPARAQTWFEWRRHGRALPAMVGLLLPFELALLIAVSDTPPLVFLILLIVLFTPPFMAAFAAATVNKSSQLASDSYGVTPFIATRPLSDAQLIAAKLRATIWSALSAWALLLVALMSALLLSDIWPMLVGRARGLSAVVGTPRVVVILLLVLSGLMVATWRQLVQSLYIGLSGREWLIKANAFFLVALLVVIGPIADWIIENGDVQAALLDGLPLTLAILVVVKMSAASWVAVRLYRTRLLSDRTLVTAAACWLILVLSLYGAFAWLLSTPLFPRYVLALLAILLIPLARLAAAPLALEWNRHR